MLIFRKMMLNTPTFANNFNFLFGYFHILTY